MRRTISRICVAFAPVLFALFCGAAQAQAYPAKPLRLILPFPPGGPSDILGRALAQKLSEQLGQNVVPDNRPGAGGNLGAELTAKSPHDGYTLLLTSPSIAISPSLYSKLNYDPARDFAPVARVASIQNVMLVHPSVPAKTLKEFIQLARSNPGKLNFGSGGAGTTNHLASELLKSLAHINMVHVPYKGSGQAMLGLMGGQVDMVVIAVPPAVPQIQAGKVRPLAVLSERRVATLPNVPTAKEAGVDNFEVAVWYGILMPGGTPREIVTRLNQEITKALAAPDLRERLSAAGIDPWPSTAEQFVDFIKSETARYAKVIKAAGVRVN
ncbi:MAG TPA: tripartite tricarboxylate transporter substrate binding protein [Burkholderiales bacterium]|nr:tripartite tricarboxylate transporter substrate binding protein [Burkholderiales bacterium]